MTKKIDTILNSFGISDVGLKRLINQDSILLLDKYGVFFVADGMGGCHKGELASQKIIENISLAFENLDISADIEEKTTIVKQSLEDTNKFLIEYAGQIGAEVVVGSTVVVLIVDVKTDECKILHSGDSRVYCMSKGRLLQLTRDHSFAETINSSRNDVGVMFRGRITKAVGISENLQLSILTYCYKKGDLFLLCSDGIHDMINQSTLCKLLRKSRDYSLNSIGNLLVYAANKSGGNDNISVVLCESIEADENAKNELRLNDAHFMDEFVDSCFVDEERIDRIILRWFIKLRNYFVFSSKIAYSLVFLLTFFILYIVVSVVLNFTTPSIEELPFFPITSTITTDNIESNLYVLMDENMKADELVDVLEYYYTQNQQLYAQIDAFTTRLAQLGVKQRNIDSLKGKAKLLDPLNNKYNSTLVLKLDPGCEMARYVFPILLDIRGNIRDLVILLNKCMSLADKKLMNEEEIQMADTLKKLNKEFTITEYYNFEYYFTKALCKAGLEYKF
jgi:protein phosphatase